MSKTYRNFFFAQVVVVLAVGLIFSVIHERIVAGAVAGSLFLALGIAILWWGIKYDRFRKSPTFAAGLVHLFGASLPLVITRFMNAAIGFEDVRVLGLPGPVFHQVSTGIYLAMMVATLFDWFRTRRIERAA